MVLRRIERDIDLTGRGDLTYTRPVWFFAAFQSNGSELHKLDGRTLPGVNPPPGVPTGITDVQRLSRIVDGQDLSYKFLLQVFQILLARSKANNADLPVAAGDIERHTSVRR